MTDSSTTTLGTYLPEVESIYDGEYIHIALRLDLPDGVHIEPHEPDDPFMIPTVVTVHGLDEVAIGYPTPVEKHLGWNDLSLNVLQGRLTFVIIGRPRPNTTVTGGLTYQPCVGGACLPPRTTVWSVPDPASVAA
ncbi:MAG: hypothetical protein ACLGHX_06270 [Acidimicrobiia bacterium]